MPTTTRRADVVVVGAGLAGLSAALRVAAAGRSVIVLEADDGPGGRVRTDLVDGFRIDRGFQVLNTAYPELRRLNAVRRLDLRRFTRGAILAGSDHRYRLVDPRQQPARLLGDLRVPLGGWGERARLLALLAGCAYLPARRVKRRSGSFREQLQRWRVDGTPAENFLRPFLSGVLLESDLHSSAGYVDLLLRTFVRGQVVVPATGVQALPDLLAADLPAASVRYGVQVSAVRADEVETAAGPIGAGAVILATDPGTAAHWLGFPPPAMHAVTTVWQAAPQAPTRDRLIALDIDNGPLVNSVVMTNVAPDYSPDARALIATSYLGTQALPEQVLHAALARLWGVEPTGWTLIATSVIARATPDLPAGSKLRRPVSTPPGMFVAGDWRDTPSTQGALVSGRRAADAALAALG